MNRWSSQHYIRIGNDQGVAPAILKTAVETAKHLHKCSPNLPPIFTLRHLAHYTGVPYGFLRMVVARNKQVEPYRVFKLKKQVRSFGRERFRFVCAPHPYLLKAQRWINREILAKIPGHEASYAYSPGSSVYDAASMHAGCRWLIKLDATNFFESILEPKIYEIFRTIGYQPLVAFELARVCTRTRPSGNPVYLNRADPNKKGLPYNSVQIGHLPQGAATSPHLSNLAARDLDESLKNFALLNQLIYTRYADDLTFSSIEEFVREDVVKKIHKIYGFMRANGLWPNKSKTQIVPPGARKIVLGLLVDGAQPRLTKEFKQEIRTHLHFLQRSDIGVRKHLKARGFDSFWGLRNFLIGKLSYAKSVEPEWESKMNRLFVKINWDT
ncbi:reverse transcriptase family protein [Pseudomonas fluorescens group sp.]|uniref:RNA-directed DNA polymerase n=2 Tax=Pseudomonas fluorescens TaxID=294 RepID=C3K519_PSEFS|nr:MULTISPECIES: reverse transcriptase family protein [Pseudomonas fluorescens group]MBZ6454925.1 reverse transcriptase family protein [Pseudomonas fluorescens group sp.]MBZ6462113.1 reverse transcriptase family protein [Pseudomonas fluorescens group sp.]MBZ6467359.1 reverse transcriptase family protein [Pseudomonas fluorescens group sp.]WQD74197.1 reverse transcriptase family protein [Pseudomonas marginalis]CAI2796190.1 Putative RNA-directed DNA polymerase [Pseudomonas fluorescens SBW25]